MSILEICTVAAFFPVIPRADRPSVRLSADQVIRAVDGRTEPPKRYLQQLTPPLRSAAAADRGEPPHATKEAAVVDVGKLTCVC